MKCQIPQISWHSRDPVLSIDFQPIQGDQFRLASGGTDSHVLIWYVNYAENNTVKIECASDLYRHNKSVNVVRFSPSGEYLASGDDEGAMFIWQLKEREILEQPKDEDGKEEWYPVKLLRGHLEDIYDISWSKDGHFLVSASMDNSAIMWDMQKFVKVHIFSDFKGYVQGVSWDPCNQFIASLGSDRTLRVHNISSKKCVSRVSKAPWTNSTEKGTIRPRLFYDDTLKSYFRRLTYSPDGELLIVPSGIIERGDKLNNACYVFSRHVSNKPVLTLPTGDWYTVAVRCNPLLYKLRFKEGDKDKPKTMINLPYRMLFAVGACDSVLLYDTEQLLPFACISNIHYTHLTDLAWSSDGLTLIASSTDGYCSFIIFTKEELGDIYVPDPSQDLEDNKMLVNAINKMDSPKEKYLPVSKINLSKSPKDMMLNSIDNDESLKNSNLSERKLDKKSPKVPSIKKFLVSPKITIKTPSTNPIDLMNKKNSFIKADINKPEPEVITLSDTPVKKTDFATNQHCTPKPTLEILNNVIILEEPGSDKIETVDEKPKCKVRLDFRDKPEIVKETEPPVKFKMSIKRFFISPRCANSDKGKEKLEKTDSKNEKISVSTNSQEKMDIDLSTNKSISPCDPDNLKTETKSKVDICVTNKPEPVMTFDENASDGKMLSSISEDTKVITKNEDDWKLELSVDADAIDVAPVNIESKLSERKSTPKRRVPFITLSSKTCLKK